MRFHLKPWLILLLIAIAVTVVVFLVRRRQLRFIRSDAEMVALLPHRDWTTVFLNVDVLRRAKLLNLLQAPLPEQERDTQEFVHETGFDTTRDLEVVAGRGDGQQIFLIVRGRFNWKRLRAYAMHHGGSCNSAYCQVPAGSSGRYASYLSIQPDTAGLAVGSDPANVLLLSPRQIEHAPAIPSEPVWVTVAHSLLSDPKDLPLPVRLFALAMQSTDRVTLAVGAGAGGDRPFELRLEAICQNAAIADTTRTQLEMDTKLLKMELQRERRSASPGDLTGLLTAGAFRQSGNSVLGSWPVYRALVGHLQ